MVSEHACLFCGIFMILFFVKVAETKQHPLELAEEA
jgi:hypothetical protein